MWDQHYSLKAFCSTKSYILFYRVVDGIHLRPYHDVEVGLKRLARNIILLPPSAKISQPDSIQVRL